MDKNEAVDSPIRPHAPGDTPHVTHTVRDDEPVVKMLVPHAFRLNEAGEQVAFPVGIYDVPTRLASHQYVIDSGAMALADAPKNHAMIRAQEDTELATKRAEEDAEIAARRTTEDAELAKGAAERKSSRPSVAVPDRASKRAEEDRTLAAGRAEEDAAGAPDANTIAARRRADTAIAQRRRVEDSQK
jgi:hypothetical protein